MTFRKPQAWQDTPETPALGQFEIHVWRINLIGTEAEENSLEDCLTDEERTRAKDFHFDQDRRRFVKRRAILRHLLASYLSISAAAVRLSFGPNGKPLISNQNAPTGIRFNCSHSGDWGLIAIARGRELGIDLEHQRPLADFMDLANDYFSHDEVSALMKITDTEKMRCFYDVWTRKEAFVKAIGLGLSFPLKDFSVSLAIDQPAKLLNVKNNPQATERWQMSAIDVNPDYSAALAFEGGNASLQYLEWNSYTQKKSG